MPLDIAHDIMTSNEVAEYLKNPRTGRSLKRITINKFYNSWVSAVDDAKDGEAVFPHTQRLPGVFKGRDVMFRRVDVEVFEEYREKNL